MAGNFPVNFPKNKIEDNLKPESVATKEDLDNKVSFEAELTMANESTNRNDKDFYEQNEDFVPLFATTKIVQDMMRGQANLATNLVQQSERNLSESSQVNTQENTDNDQLPASLVKAAQQANQKFFTEFSSQFKQLFMAELKGKGVLADRFSSEFDVPKINIGQIMDELVARVKLLRSGEVTHLKLDLHPEKLGRLQVLLSMQDKKLVLHIFSTDEAKKILDNEVEKLQKVLSEQGFDIEHLEVEVHDQRKKNESETPEYFSLDNGKTVPHRPYDMLKIVQQADIINSIDRWLGDVIINYIA